MKVSNIHSRIYSASSEEVGRLLDTLSSSSDLLWPHALWPKMKFDRPLSVGADGGHGPIRYFVEEYSEGKRVKFHFTGPRGFDGYHQYEVIEVDPNKTELCHSLVMDATGVANITWPLLFRPLHDALIEDSLGFVEHRLGISPQITRWSPWVKTLRWIITGGKGGPQKIP